MTGLGRQDGGMTSPTTFNPDDFPQPTLISVNGVELEVFEAGRENAGKPIVLCHGWPEHAFSWRHQMPALAAAGYHVIVPNQRGYGRSSRPADVAEYDIEHLTGDLVALLDHYGYEDATFVGHDWGAMVVWGLTLLHPDRVNNVINLSLPYQERGDRPWIEFMEEVLGGDFYFVHFNRQPGVADAVFDANTRRFLRNLYRKNEPPRPPQPGMALIDLARAEAPLGEPVMSDGELAVFVAAFESTGFTGSVNWYRNLDRNWHLLADVDPIIRQHTLMIYGDRDVIQKSERLAEFVPAVEVVSLDCGHWIQQELPEETNQAILKWLNQREAARDSSVR
ncbi:pimeloyl-ACP methyl ester carboxylesterase [Allocatelliglobosispora scoriae]|uniref:Pimeloyl-ACP methyl ester carboxylesterase n=1 Tax=Allocatelliglobosispora scoriae TaxID=643052 RepID=A0A841BJ92_9ACTN|nr:alpha/beta hydrolase [Allocatelliglobosispora scoriae]MBB5867239.1 pimeloyl-ACP methyl ester carboxylesterase [Allocatelliglobosispora scoriae]